MHAIGVVAFWLVFGLGVVILMVLALALLVDAVIRDQYSGPDSYRRDEREM